MQLGRRPTGSGALDVASALRETTAGAGDQPAFTVLRADRREEQGFRTFAQWVAKGAHLLQVDFDVQPGDAVHLDSPAGWGAAAVAYACWWLGGRITQDPEQAVVSVRHERRPGPVAADALWLGDSLDAGPNDPALTSWSAEVVVFPDSPPPSAGRSDALALAEAGLAQAELLAQARALGSGAGGTMGLRRADLLVGDWAAALLRPVVVGRATVIVDDARPPAVEQEPVDWWYDPADPPDAGPGSMR